MQFWLHVISLTIIRLCQAQLSFYQDDSDIVNDRIVIHKYNKTYLKDAFGRVYKYNDTVVMKAISFGALFKKEIANYFYMSFGVQKFISKRYRSLPFNFTVELCEEYRKLGQQNPFGIKTAIEISNFRGCPLLKGQHYHINDWIVEQEKFPPHMPAGKYSLVVKGWAEQNDWLFDAAWFGEVIPKK